VARAPSALFSLSRDSGGYQPLRRSLLLERQPTALAQERDGSSALLATVSGPLEHRRSDLLRLWPDGRLKEQRWNPLATNHYVIRLACEGPWVAAVLEVGEPSSPSAYQIVLQGPPRPRHQIAVETYEHGKPRCLGLIARPEAAPLLLWAGAERSAQVVACDAPGDRVAVELSDLGGEAVWDENLTPRFLTHAGEGQVLLGAGQPGVPRSGRVWLLTLDPEGRLTQRWTRGFERPLAAAQVAQGHLVALAQDGSLWIQPVPR